MSEENGAPKIVNLDELHKQIKEETSEFTLAGLKKLRKEREAGRVTYEQYTGESEGAEVIPIRGTKQIEIPAEDKDILYNIVVDALKHISPGVDLDALDLEA